MKILILRGFVSFALIWFVLETIVPDVKAQVTGGPPRTSLPTSADGGNLGSGKLNFQPDLFTGRFTYSVPINVPPGRQNSQPNLALSYNSSVGNGWCGVGWNLEIGKIERETRYGVPVLYATNGVSRYDDSKSFTASFGNVSGHLVKVSPNGQTPAEYRLSVDKTFIKFLYYNQVSNAYWSVLDKGGNQYFFGESISNRTDNPNFSGGFGTNTFCWGLDRIIDPNGNSTYIDYTNIYNVCGTETNYENQLYPVRISYGGNVNSPSLPATNTISFVFTNRSDQTFSFKEGFRRENRELISQIIVKAGSQSVRRYVLKYTNSPSTMRSLLASVIQYGADDVSTLPPVTFSYQLQNCGFGPLQSWGGLNSQGNTNVDWNSISATANSNTFVVFKDMDGDGLPDRVMRLTNSPYNGFIVQRNTGSNFVGNYFWGGLTNQMMTNASWGSLTRLNGNATVGDFFDINGDGKPDRVLNNTSSNWWVQLNNGTPGTNAFSAPILWGTLAANYPDIHNETQSGSQFTASEEMVDVNGDGLVDRFFGETNKVQLNTGSGFGPLISFPYLESTKVSAGTDYMFLWEMIDMNGDGLPDNIYTTGLNFYQVWYNNGGQIVVSADTCRLGEIWRSVTNETIVESNQWLATGLTDNSGANAQFQLAMLADINGDGLPDRILTKYASPYNRFKVQLNNGSGFGSMIDWTNVLSEAGSNNQAWNSPNYSANGQTVVALVDINGDGLPDRVMRKLNAPYTNFMVQLNLGPFPDLLCSVSNGIGGSVKVSYLPSTQYDNYDRNWTNNPWAEGAKSLLPFPIYTVSSTVVNDGFGNLATNTYAYQHGMFDSLAREFRGFNSVTVTDPYGAKTVTSFHQSGGFDDSANGEFQDQGTFAKKGMPYRVETYGTNGLLYQRVLNKVQEFTLNTNGWYFPCVSQTIVMNYEGLNTYRATAIQRTYDTNTANLIAEADLGEVGSVVLNGQTFTDVPGDSLYKWITYTNIGNILNRPVDTKITTDSAGASRLQEALTTYDANGNPKTSQSWLDTTGAFITTVSNSYDQYGNVQTTTDAAGITTTVTYDSTYQQFPISAVTATFTSSSTYDNRSGRALTSTDAKGLVSSNSYDVFFRPVASFISTNSYTLPTLWQTRTYYSLGGISNGISYNFVRSQVNDAVDAVNGFETYSYADGLGRTIETRAEAETGQYRVANAAYDSRGNSCFTTLSYFSSGTTYTAPSGTLLGSLTEYDPIGRAFRSTPAVNGLFTAGQLTSTTATSGDSGSPVGAATTSFVDGSNPWASVVTDANGKTKKSYRDAYGRTIQVTDIVSSGNINTTYGYDLLGNLTNVTDNANNSTVMGYDSLGRKISMTDPDMGVWDYWYDNAGRMTQQTDARTNSIVFNYTDPLGRLVSKQIYNQTNSLVGTVTYTYDTSDDGNYTVFPGQLYKVTDLQGSERFSYDVRGRTLKDARFLKVNAMEYVTQSTYDDAGRVKLLTYPAGVATVQYSYDTAGHLSQVKSLSGTGTNETFYTPASFNALNQLSGYANGNGVATTYAYYGNSKRLQNITTGKSGTNCQNLTYTFDSVSDITSVGDGVYSGTASAAISSVTYDDLYRITSLNSTARGVKNYAYNSLGNILTNQDNGSGLYQYGPKPHAVISANSVNYGYDAGGNMTTRGSQTLAYDEQNQLAKVIATNGTVAFGYDESGERLWRAGTNGYTVWIGGIYEINNGKVLCHVIAGGQLIATFEPQCNAGLSQVFGEQNWFAASTAINSIVGWPFQHGRGQWTIFGGTWVGIAVLCLVAGRGTRLKRYEWRRALRPMPLFRQAVTVTFISAFLFGSIGNADAAPAYNPVFYYYHPDPLGSSNILTDRAGNVVQHYEYATFGQTSYQNNTSAFPVSNRYTGQIADDETGLLYYGGRYYDPQLGRFIQPDPTIPDPTDSQSLNRYSYCRNNPLNETDPSGFTDGDPSPPPDFPPDNGFPTFPGSNGYPNQPVEIWIIAYKLPVSIGGGNNDTLPPYFGDINGYTPPGVTPFTFDNPAFQNGAPPSGGSGWLKATGNFVADSVFNAELLKQSWDELRHPDFSSGMGVATYGTAMIGMAAGSIDAASNLIPGKAVLEGAIKGGVKAMGEILVKEGGKIAEELLVRKHHSWPKYLGGALKQDLVPLSKPLHDAYHSGLDKILARQKGSSFYAKISGAARQQMYRDLADYTKAFDAKYGTKLYEAMLKEGFPKP